MLRCSPCFRWTMGGSSDETSSRTRDTVAEKLLSVSLAVVTDGGVKL